jgi:thioredoxin-related protein
LFGYYHFLNDKYHTKLNSGTLAKLFGVRATPSSFFINPKGRIQFSEVGYVTTLGYRLRLWWAEF